jgi:limonene-1,2-epoxide hydrolase
MGKAPREFAGPTNFNERAVRMSNIGLARKFLAALSAGDIDALAEIVSPHLLYNGEPFVTGGEDLRKRLIRFFGASGVAKVRIMNIAESGSGNVLLERADEVIVESAGLTAQTSMATFEFYSGKLASWRDYALRE